MDAQYKLATCVLVNIFCNLSSAFGLHVIILLRAFFACGQSNLLLDTCLGNLLPRWLGGSRRQRNIFSPQFAAFTTTVFDQ
jgi:hypothetical protein